MIAEAPSLSISLHPGQVKALKAMRKNPKRFVLRAGRRWGKTTLLVNLALLAVLRGERVGWFAPTFPHQEEVWRELMTRLAPIRGVIQARETPHPWVKIPVGGGLEGNLEMWSLASGYSVARGRRYHIAIVDEAAFAPALLEVLEGAILPTLLDYNGFLWVASTPWRGNPAFKALWEKGVAARWSFYHAPTWDNPHIPREALDELKATMDPLRWEEEIAAEFVDSIGGGVFPREVFEAPGFRVGTTALPELAYVVVGVDPAIEDLAGDETGIIVAALGKDGRYYILEDASGRLGPARWPERVRDVYRRHNADVVVVEANQGGDMVVRLLEGVPVRKVKARVGKRLRAEPIAALYRMGRVSHVGVFPELERQMVSWTPADPYSPDRLDAMVWALSYIESQGWGVRWKPKAWHG